LKQSKISSGSVIDGKHEVLTYYPWESLACEDFDQIACEKVSYSIFFKGYILTGDGL